MLSNDVAFDYLLVKSDAQPRVTEQQAFVVDDSNRDLLEYGGAWSHQSGKDVKFKEGIPLNSTLSAPLEIGATVELKFTGMFSIYFDPSFPHHPAGRTAVVYGVTLPSADPGFSIGYSFTLDSSEPTELKLTSPKTSDGRPQFHHKLFQASSPDWASHNLTINITHLSIPSSAPNGTIPPFYLDYVLYSSNSDIRLQPPPSSSGYTMVFFLVICIVGFFGFRWWKTRGDAKASKTKRAEWDPEAGVYLPENR